MSRSKQEIIGVRKGRLRLEPVRCTHEFIYFMSTCLHSVYVTYDVRWRRRVGHLIEEYTTTVVAHAWSIKGYIGSPRPKPGEDPTMPAGAPVYANGCTVDNKGIGRDYTEYPVRGKPAMRPGPMKFDFCAEASRIVK